MALAAMTAVLYGCGQHPAGSANRPPPSPSPTAPRLQSAAQLASALTAAETGIRSPSTPDARVAELAHQQQLAYLELAGHPDWLPAVLDAMPPTLKLAVQNNFDAMAGVAVLNPPLSSPPSWHVVAAPPPDQLLSYYREAEQAFGVPWQYLAAIHFIETSFSRIDSDSTAGAQGPMQFVPSTWAEYGQGDIHSTHDAILAAARYLQASGAPAQMGGAVHAYLGYYHWRVYVATRAGPTFLDPG